jgi:hypothetical protein
VGVGTSSLFDKNNRTQIYAGLAPAYRRQGWKADLDSNPECSGWNGFKKKQMGQWMLDILKSSRLVGILIGFNPPDHILSSFHCFLFCFGISLLFVGTRQLRWAD